MCKNEESKAISKVELILPANVVEACWTLEKNSQSFFFAVNEHDKTSSEINLHKLGDNSVKIRVTVFPLTDQEDEEADVEQASASAQPSESLEIEEPPAFISQKSPRRGKGVKVETPRTTRSSAAAAEEGSQKRGAIADTVKRMKNVLSPPKLTQEADDARVRFVHHDDEDEEREYEEDEENAPKASTIIIVKGPGEEEDEAGSSSPAPRKKSQRVHTTTTASGKQIVYRGKGKRKDDDTPAKGAAKKRTRAAAAAEGEGADEGSNGDAEGKSFTTLKTIKKEKEKEGRMSQAWKSIGVGEEQPSGDVVISADSLRTATENFQMNVNDIEYNFEVQEKEPVMRTSTKQFNVEGDGAPPRSKRRHSLAMIPPQKVWCMICGKTLQNYSYLYRHVRQFHRDISDVGQYLDEIKPLMKTPCPICGKEISSMSNMSSHIQQCHPETPEPYRCQICNGFYKTRISLKHHMQSQHSENRRSYPCKFCGATFTETRSLKEHINCTHETTEVFTCEVCHKTFLTRGRLRRHMYIHGEFRLFCKYCGKGFHLKDNMNKHVELIHEKRNQYRYKCDYCSKAFNVKGNLMQHVNGVHLRTLPYRCPICDMGWRKKSTMLAHMKEHAVKGEGGEGVAAAAAAAQGGEFNADDVEQMESHADESLFDTSQEDETMYEGEEGEEPTEQGSAAADAAPPALNQTV